MKSSVHIPSFEMTADPDQILRKKFALDVRNLSRLQPWRSTLALALDWALIAFVATLSERWFNPLLYVFCAALIAGRQHALLVMVHEGAHHRLFENQRWNNFVSDAFAAFPLIFDTEMYRQHHRKHHRHLNTDQDPDWARKIPLSEWQFPKPWSFLRKSLPKFLLINGPREWLTFSLHFCGVLPVKTLFSRSQLRRLMVRGLYYGATLSIFAYFGRMDLLALYWFIPYLFIFPGLQRIRSVAEHFGLPRTHEFNATRNVLAKWYEKAFFGPHAVGFHLTHHLFPSVPFYHLQKLNQILLSDAEYMRYAHQNSSYVWPSKHPLWRDLFAPATENVSPNNKSEKIAA